MANLDRIVNVQIALRTTGITELSFSDMLILSPHVLSPGRVMVVTSPGELLDLGLSATDPLYLAVRDAFKPIPAIRQVYIGRQQVNTVTLTAAVPAAVGTVYTATVAMRGADGLVVSESHSYTSIADDDASDVATALSTAINAGTLAVTATPTAGAIAVAADVSGTGFGLTIAGPLTMAQPTSAEAPTIALNAALGESGGSGWYGLILTDRTESVIKDAAEWTEANEKLMMTASDSVGVTDPAVTTDLASYFETHQYFRSGVFYHAAADTEYPDAALMSEAFTYVPGSETWAMKKLPGISVDPLTEGQSIAARNKNATTFEMFRNFAITQGGKVGAGEWIDVIRFRDYIAEQIRVSVVSAMINADGKVPYTDDGIQLIGNAIRGPLNLAVGVGIAPPEMDADDNVIPSYVLTLPRSQSVSFNDKANRVLNNVKFTARLSGAIHAVNINGSLSYSL